MADLPSILGGMAQGFLDFGKSAVDLFGTGGASIADLIESARTGKVTTRNSDDFRKWLYDTNDVKDAAAKGLGTALNGVQTVSDYIPGIGAVTRNPLFNAGQGALGGLADEFKMYGKDYDLGRAGQRAAVGAGGALASTGLADALKGSGNALLKSGTAQGLARGAVGGAIGAGGYTAIDGGSLGDVANSALQGAGMGAALGGTMGALQDFRPAKTYDVGLTDDERASRLKEVRKMRNAIGSEKAYMSGALDEASENRWSELYNLEQAYKNGFDNYNDYHDTLRPVKGLDDETLGQVLKNMKEPELQPWMQKGSHQPTFDPTMSSLASSMDRTISGESFMPDDFYQHMDWYGGGDTKPYLESASAIQKIKGNPNAKVTMYRATVGDTIYPNDWVTLSPEYAKQHLANALRDQPDAKIIKQTVAARDLRWPGDDINEFGYYPITNGDIARAKALETTLADADMAVNSPKLTPEQEAYFKDSVVRDENGNLIPMYHGTRGNFTVFGDNAPSDTSNSHASVGNWFTPTKEGAKNFAESIWYGDGEPTVMETYLNVKNPKVYETVDNSKAVEALTKELREMELNSNKLSDTELYSKNIYDASMAQRMLEQEGKDTTVKWLSGKGYGDEKAAKFVDEIADLNEQALKKKSLQDRISELRYGDAYQRFKTDIYKMDGQTAEDANVGGTGMALNDKSSIKKYVDKLKSEGYDGIIIKGTRYDADTMGGPNDQYVVFDSNQIKDINNLRPTSDVDIMAEMIPEDIDLGRTLSRQDLSVNSAKIAPGQLGLFDDMPTQTPKTGTRQTSLFDQPQEGVDYYGEDIEAPAMTPANPYAPVDGQVTQAMRDRAADILGNWKKNGVPENELYNAINQDTLPDKVKSLKEIVDGGAYDKRMKELFGTTDIKKADIGKVIDYLYESEPARADNIKNNLLAERGLGKYEQRFRNRMKKSLYEAAQERIANDIGANGLASSKNIADVSIRQGYTAAADEALSERLGIAPGNTPKYNGAMDTRNAFGRYSHPSYREGGDLAVFERKMSSPEDAISTVAHERLHSFQGELEPRSKGRYDKEVLEAYEQLRRDLAPHYKSWDETAERYGHRGTGYWQSTGEQESRMLQNYLENKGYTDSTHMKSKYRAGEWGNEINPAFDKFFDKLRDLSKRGVALPALTALFGGGAYMASQENDKEKEVK